MPDDRESPSGGWRTVYAELGADPDVEEATHPCPDCCRTCEHVLRDVYECTDHGVFRASADSADLTGELAHADDGDDLDEETTRASGRAD